MPPHAVARVASPPAAAYSFWALHVVHPPAASPRTSPSPRLRPAALLLPSQRAWHALKCHRVVKRAVQIRLEKDLRVVPNNKDKR